VGKGMTIDAYMILKKEIENKNPIYKNKNQNII
jgi:hypothetical protein